MAKKSDAPVYEIGELDKTRKNLGSIDTVEAMRMSKVLGGTVGVERAKKQGRVITRNSAVSNGPEGGVSFEKSVKKQISTSTKEIGKKAYTLPAATVSEEKLFYNALVDFDICKKANIFNFLFSLGKVKATYLSPIFIKKTIPTCIKQIGHFVDSVQKIVNNATPEYKVSIMEGSDSFSKTIAAVYKWNNMPLLELSAILDREENPTIEHSVPFLKELFKYLMKFYLLGEAKMGDTLKTLYAESSEEKPLFKNKNAELAKQAISCWVYINEHVFFRMYPLLNRLSSNKYSEYSNFYSKESQKIFPFLEITKFDIIVPDKKVPEKKKRTETETKTQEKVVEKEGIHASILQSLKVLNNLFPNAGWQTLDRNPDMYGYFKGIYSFPDFFRMVSPEHPLQITLILLKVVEDLFSGLRSINFDDSSLITKSAVYFEDNYSFTKLMEDWPYYCNELFNKELLPELREYVNRTELQADFIKSKYGKKQLTNFLWKIKYYFLPHLEFDIMFLERSNDTFQVPPLSKKIRQATAYLNAFINDASSESAQKTLLDAEYKFAVTTQMSFRLNILLRGKNTKLNLLKYTYHILRVLDWWVNNESSLAYDGKKTIPYRDSGLDLIDNLKSINAKEMFVAYTKQRLEKDTVQKSEPLAKTEA